MEEKEQFKSLLAPFNIQNGDIIVVRVNPFDFELHLRFGVVIIDEDEKDGRVFFEDGYTDCLKELLKKQLVLASFFEEYETRYFPFPFNNQIFEVIRTKDGFTGAKQVLKNYDYDHIKFELGENELIDAYYLNRSRREEADRERERKRND